MVASVTLGVTVARFGAALAGPNARHVARGAARRVARHASRRAARDAAGHVLRHAAGQPAAAHGYPAAEHARREHTARERRAEEQQRRSPSIPRSTTRRISSELTPSLEKARS